MTEKQYQDAINKIGETKILSVMRALSINQLRGIQVKDMTFDEFVSLILNEFEKVKDDASLYMKFKDTLRQHIKKVHVSTFRKDYDDKGRPLIVLNDWSEKILVKNNPIARQTLLYVSIEERDEDYERLNKL